MPSLKERDLIITNSQPFYPLLQRKLGKTMCFKIISLQKKETFYLFIKKGMNVSFFVEKLIDKSIYQLINKQENVKLFSLNTQGLQICNTQTDSYIKQIFFDRIC